MTEDSLDDGSIDGVVVRNQDAEPNPGSDALPLVKGSQPDIAPERLGGPGMDIQGCQRALRISRPGGKWIDKLGKSARDHPATGCLREPQKVN